MSRFEDQSAVIINRATLAEAKSSSFNFNTNVVGFNNITFKDGLGQGFTVKNSNLNVLPSMASGVFKPKGAKRNMTFGYALYHANTDNLNFSDRTERKLNLVNEVESPGMKITSRNTPLTIGWMNSRPSSAWAGRFLNISTSVYHNRFYIDRWSPANPLPPTLFLILIPEPPLISLEQTWITTPNTMHYPRIPNLALPIKQPIGILA